MERVKNKKTKVLSNLVFILKYTWQWKRSIFLSIGFYSVFYSLSPFVWIYAPKFLVDELTNGMRFRVILEILLVTLIAAAVTDFMTEYLQGNFRMKMNAVRYRFIGMLSEKTMIMDYPYTEDPDTLNDINIALRMIQSPGRGIGFIILKLLGIPGNIIGFFAFSVIIFRLNWIVLAFLILSVALSYLIMQRTGKYERSRREDLSDAERRSRYSTRTMSDFQYGKDIRAYGLKKLLLAKKQGFDRKLLGVTKDIENRKLRNYSLDSLLMLVREVVIYGYLVYGMLYLGMTIGNFIMYLAAMKGFITWMDTTMKDIAEVYVQCLYVSDFRNFLNKKEPENKADAVKIPECEQYEIEFRNVSFLYPGSSKYIFKNFSLKIKAGERLALVGVNGAGKTTLVKLLTRLYQPTEGNIYINGIDINEFDRKEYIGLIAPVFQEIKLFAFNIKENITFEEDGKDNDKLIKAIEQAGLKEKISSLEKGVLTNIFKIFDENGVELSGGENQKLALARALYKGGKIIIMDEPTAALDALAEYHLYKSFDELIGNRTAVYISHRLSSTRFCDAVAFIEDGEVKEYGTHEELMKLGKLYANMFRIQAQYYNEEEKCELLKA